MRGLDYTLQAPFAFPALPMSATQDQQPTSPVVPIGLGLDFEDERYASLGESAE